MDTTFENIILGNQLTAVLLFDASLRVQYMNAAAEMLFATSARSVQGQSAVRMLQCSDDSLQEHLHEAMDAHQPLTERGTEIYRADGKRITVDCTLVPVLDQDKKPALLAELRQVDRQLRLSREEQIINQTSATRDLLRGLAHEIKNPLGGLRGAAQLLESELGNADLMEYTQVIIDEADRLQALVDQMLGPNQLPVKEGVNVHDILEYVCSIVGAEVGERIKIERDYDPSIPEIEGDRGQLIQAVMNLIKNAIESVGDGGSIRLQTRVQRNFTIANMRHRLVAEINIVDDGPGIAAEMQERLFYPMVTDKPEGTGLGLSIAQTIVNRHAGLIEFSSKPGRTVFTLYLPIGAY